MPRHALDITNVYAEGRGEEDQDWFCAYCDCVQVARRGDYCSGLCEDLDQSTPPAVGADTPEEE